MSPSRSHRSLVVSGIVVVAVYLLGAAISGRLSPLAREPVLDGLAPQPYRWVDPPPALAADNQPPSGGTFRVQLTGSGSRTGVFATDDNAQVTLILERGAFASVPGAEAVEVTMTPIAATEVEPADPPLTIVGNVVRLEAMYRPSGDPADIGPGTARIVLAYPVLTPSHGGHSVVASADGRTWTRQDTNDLPSIRQADALLSTLAYAAVAEEPTASPTAPAASSTNTIAVAVIVSAIVVLLVGLFFTLRRRSSTPARGRHPLQAAKRPPSRSKGPEGKTTRKPQKKKRR